MFCPSAVFHTPRVTAIFVLIAALHNIHWSVFVTVTTSDSQFAKDGIKFIYDLQYGVQCAACHRLTVIPADRFYAWCD